MRKSIGLKVFAIFALIFLICILGFGVIAYEVNNMSKINENICGAYLTSIEELDTISINLANLKADIKDYFLADNETRLSVKDSITTLQGNTLSALQVLSESAISTRQSNTVQKVTDAYNDYTNELNATLTAIDSGAITTYEDINERLSEVTSTLEVYIKSVNVLNTANMILSQNELDKQARNTNIAMIIAGVLLIASFVSGMLVTFLTVARPTKNATKELADIVGGMERRDGDLTRRVKEHSNDEAGQLVKGINKFIDMLQVIIKQIKIQSASMIENVHTVNEQVKTADGNITDVSAAMEELSMSMSEIARVADDINQQTEEVASSVVQIASEASRGSDKAKEVQSRAHQLKQQGIDRKQDISNMAADISLVMQKALDKSQDVKMINDLTADILDISSQTNLLALNASIEAARAGEAGKGFAVVADEIRSLADSSRATANKIQEISEQVTNSVNELAGNANKMIDFIMNAILPDYDTLVDTGTKYSSDATEFETILRNFAESADMLSSTMDNVKELINNISVTISECSDGINNTSGNANDLTMSVSQIREEVNQTALSADKLIQEIDMFKNV